MQVPSTLRWALPFVSVLLFLIVWGTALKAPYQFDDYITPLQDTASTSISAWASNAFKTLRPLTKLTYALESEFGLTEASERRPLSIFMALLCMGLLARLLLHRNVHVTWAIGAALLWAIHPVHAESFISLAGRSTLLSMLFVLLSLNSKEPLRKIGFAFLAVLSKEVALLYFIYVLWENGRHFWKTGLILLVPGCYLVFNERMLGLIQYSFREALYITPWWEGVSAISAGFVYLLIPSKVSIELEFPYFHSAIWFFVSIVLLGLVIRDLIKQKNHALILWLLFILPTQSLIPKLDPLSLRPLSYSFLALPLIFVLPKFTAKSSLILIPLIAVTSFYSFKISEKYNDPVELWRDASVKTLSKTRPLINLSYFLSREERYEEALEALQEARKRAPLDVEVVRRIEALELIRNTKRSLR